MQQILNSFADYYYLLENGAVYNINTNQTIQADCKHLFKLKTVDNNVKRISQKTLYRIVYNKPFSIDNIENIDNEQWKCINNTDGFYYISNKGRIKSLHKYITTLLNPYPNNHGYMRVDIIEKGGNRRTVLVHRLVAQYFLPFPQNIDMQLHHKDFNKNNNSSDNLEWLTTSQHKKKHNERNKIKNVSA